jgi:hypothetical protein
MVEVKVEVPSTVPATVLGRLRLLATHELCEA